MKCELLQSFDSSTSETRMGFGSDLAALRGALSPDHVSRADIEAGLYEAARIQTFAVDWSTGDTQLRRTYRIREIRYTDGGELELELAGLLADLDRVAGRAVSRLCGARFGDARCGLDSAQFAEGTTCPRTHSACRDFGNSVNFRGFPHLIGDDALVQGPIEGLQLDGGSRYVDTDAD